MLYICCCLSIIFTRDSVFLRCLPIAWHPVSLRRRPGPCPFEHCTPDTAYTGLRLRGTDWWLWGFLPFDSRRLASQNGYPTPRGFRFFLRRSCGVFYAHHKPGACCLIRGTIVDLSPNRDILFSHPEPSTGRSTRVRHLFFRLGVSSPGPGPGLDRERRETPNPGLLSLSGLLTIDDRYRSSSTEAENPTHLISDSQFGRLWLAAWGMGVVRRWVCI